MSNLLQSPVNLLQRQPTDRRSKQIYMVLLVMVMAHASKGPEDPLFQRLGLRLVGLSLGLVGLSLELVGLGLGLGLGLVGLKLVGLWLVGLG